MTTSSVTPTWAVELVRQVCADAGVAPPATLRWRRRARPTSSGVTRRALGSISIVSGLDAADQRLTLLHELAHWITPPPRGRRGRVAHHGRTFYERAFGLYRRHGLGETSALTGEVARYPGALRHAVALGVAGAVEASAARRRELRDRRGRGRWEVAVPEHAVRLERDGRWTVCATCRQRVVGPVLVRLRRRRSPARHLLMRRVP